MKNEITRIFNRLATQEEDKLKYGQLKKYAQDTSTKVLKKYISNRTNEQWDINCTVANDELIKRGK
tara:strand:+ start:7948 stop:8145 length:198 start_codon:yes stop_codon:yes gene_type:complete